MIHGGDVYTDGLLQGRELIDYSSNINPLGVPKSFIDNINEAINALTRYPDIQYRKVLKGLKEYVDCPEEYFVLGNGAAEIIDLVIACHKSLLIVVPSFVEYEIDAKKWGCNIEYSYLKEDINYNDLLKNEYAQLSYDYKDILNKLQKVEAIVLGNPNNPNGNIINRGEFQKILEYCESNNKVIIIDEAFIEFTGDSRHSFVDEVKKYKCLFIIRALTKFFAMPGIRFGYGISSNATLIKNIKSKQNPWNINCFAEVAVRHVLKDSAYIEKSKEWIRAERPRFLKSLKKNYFIEEVFLTYGNYVLCKLKGLAFEKGLSSEKFYKICLEQGFVIRKADNFRGLDKQYVRLAIKDRASNEKLVAMLESLKFKV
ncbi:aminotransferase class I/II-fold pyridoxal phosphate-dependent enzyme [Clostridium tagluense]|uniref:pyridoxal phosphate-dependent aminotransferase n=1 Tax=Clostridium tagluense TaxID=360422 RepID=UPI001CF5F33C|nr:histidinol-phosphate transaminase [Clostridium tagluense]MCB2311995.1 aminotransferase class I/II-fold pyridoxal phosphate-dependent enzyme [Clostridium tagluense]MCB2316582.1 aminotransferase class I/II-fold pyridoxal phosphate-dependent enzyme [Clostridium tagluense]MCB2321482.1 aminotransferase class I/II-fold pyridoxal phosphate-dependent enzyme [Clostridium tagluense]MCB2326494.1 aminotransferase class I/II-fold pyridoxal phosphate-dependent enzyme [Clostridium tagluense]MCB2331174.1 a